MHTLQVLFFRCSGISQGLVGISRARPCTQRTSCPSLRDPSPRLLLWSWFPPQLPLCLPVIEQAVPPTSQWPHAESAAIVVGMRQFTTNRMCLIITSLVLRCNCCACRLSRTEGADMVSLGCLRHSCVACSSDSYVDAGPD